MQQFLRPRETQLQGSAATTTSTITSKKFNVPSSLIALIAHERQRLSFLVADLDHVQRTILVFIALRAQLARIVRALDIFRHLRTLGAGQHAWRSDDMTIMRKSSYLRNCRPL